MANLSLLYGSPDLVPHLEYNSDAIILEATYRIPALWLLAFDEISPSIVFFRDDQMNKIDRIETNVDFSDQDNVTLFKVSDLKNFLFRAAYSAQKLRLHLPAKSYQYIEMWLEFMATVSNSYVHMQFDEIAWLYEDSGAFMDGLRRAGRYGRTANFEDLLSLAAISGLVVSPDGTLRAENDLELIEGLVGYDANGRAPWAHLFL